MSADAGASLPPSRSSSAEARCLCQQSVINRSWKCKQCNFHYCTKQCKNQFKLLHSLLCSGNRSATSFLGANAQFLHLWGMWLKLHRHHQWIGVHLELTADCQSVAKSTPLDLPSVRELLSSLQNARTPMLDAGYPESFELFISWKGLAHGHREIDMSVGGRVLINCDLNEPVFKEPNRFFVPPSLAAQGMETKQWFQKQGVSLPSTQMCQLRYMNFQMWQEQQQVIKRTMNSKSG